jgi:hypothetical protein
LNWKEAQQKTLEMWRGIPAAIDRQDELELLTEINAVCDLCETAVKESESGGVDRCDYCLHYQQFGGCQGVSLMMSEAVVTKEWEELRALVNEFIRQVEELEMPSEAQ